MGLTRGERWILAAVLASLALMLAVFGLRALPTVPLALLSPAAIETAAGEEVPREERININTAGLEELMSLPNIGETRARAILDDRAANGPYRYPEDLIRVSGIGEGIVSGLLDHITTGGEGDAENFGG